METGEIIFKYNVGYALPSSPTVLDSNSDGFHDRVYFADSNGGIWRIQYPDPDSSGEGSLIPESMRPVAVSTVVDGAPNAWGLAIGSGDRANLGDVDGVVNHFFFLLDLGDTTTRYAGDLLPVDYTALDGSYTCSTNALDPASGLYGWYLSLRPNEKVMSDAPVVDGHVIFTTFDPTPDVVATHNAPDECIPDDGATTEEGDGSTSADPEVICSASGLGRYYDLWFECGLGDYSENDSGFSGVETYTDGNTTYVKAPSTNPNDPDEGDEFEHLGSHIVTNWRQD